MENTIDKKKLDAQQEQIREQQKETWNQFAPGWKKWDNWVMNFIKPVGDEIIRQLKLKETDVVLDVATGTAEPGLTIASIVKKGKVVGQDISDNMLAVACENAVIKGISNYETKSCDISELPFFDNSFDAISCRFGFMFFPDMLTAAKEINRVLKPGGRFVTSVWGPPEKNFWVTSMMGPVMRNMQIQPPPAGAPGMFRCADPSQMTGLFKQAGMKNIVHKEVNDKTEVESIDFFWTYMNEVAAPIVSAMSKADDAMKVKIKREVFDGIRQKYSSDVQLKFDYQAIVFYGEK